MSNSSESNIEISSEEFFKGYTKVIKQVGDTEIVYYLDKNKTSSTSSSSSTTTESVEPSSRIVTVDCLCKINRGIKDCCNIF